MTEEFYKKAVKNNNKLNFPLLTILGEKYKVIDKGNFYLWIIVLTKIK